MAFRHLAIASFGAVAFATSPLAIWNETQLNSALESLTSGSGSNFAASYINLLSAIVPSPAPTNVQDAATVLSAVYAARTSDVYGRSADIVLSGMTGGTPFADLGDLANFGACNNHDNINPQPSAPVYPKVAPNDAPYDLPEEALRAAIYIPPGFTYGDVQPVLFIPGTGVEACESFANNLGKLFSGSDFADPVYVNIPGNQLGDAQTNSEYVAYAINYIFHLTNVNVAVVAWSQGCLNTQWALKYWPSTRRVVNDFIAISPDFHGTVEADLLCPLGVPCDPSIQQQSYYSNFVATLRKNGGDSAYVPTTEIHSIFDEIVEPQQDPIPGASGHVDSANGVAATNVQIQDICPPGTPAGGPDLGHESTLYNAVTYAVVRDALTYDGPADIIRSGASSQCGSLEAPGLDLEDLFATEVLIPLLLVNLLLYPDKTIVEPPIKPYATY